MPIFLINEYGIYLVTDVAFNFWEVFNKIFKKTCYVSSEVLCNGQIYVLTSFVDILFCVEFYIPLD